MRAIIMLMLGFAFIAVVMTVIAIREHDVTVGFYALILGVTAALLLWQLTRKYRAQKRGFWVSVGLLLLSLFVPTDG